MSASGVTYTSNLGKDRSRGQSSTGQKGPNKGARQHGYHRPGKGGTRGSGGPSASRRRLEGRFHAAVKPSLRKLGTRQAYRGDEKKAWFNRMRPNVETSTYDTRMIYQDVIANAPNQTYVKNPDTDQIGYNMPSDDTGLFVYRVPNIFHIQLTPFWYATSRRRNYTGAATAPDRSSVDMLTGNTRFIMNMRTKITLTLPSMAFRPWATGANVQAAGADMYFVHGWIKDAPHWLDRGSVQANERPYPPNVPRDSIARLQTFRDYKNWIRTHVNEWFNERKDPLRFMNKRKSRLKILGYQSINKLMTLEKNKNAMIDNRGLSPLGAPLKALTGPIINYVADFGDIYRKVHYTHGANEISPGTHGSQAAFNFPNASTWTPFCVVFIPEAEKWTEALDDGNAIIKCAHNTQIWYTE